MDDLAKEANVPQIHIHPASDLPDQSEMIRDDYHQNKAFNDAMTSKYNAGLRRWCQSGVSPIIQESDRRSPGSPDSGEKEILGHPRGATTWVSPLRSSFATEFIYIQMSNSNSDYIAVRGLGFYAAAPPSLTNFLCHCQSRRGLRLQAKSSPPKNLRPPSSTPTTSQPHRHRGQLLMVRFVPRFTTSGLVECFDAHLPESVAHSESAESFPLACFRKTCV